MTKLHKKIRLGCDYHCYEIAHTKILTLAERLE